MERAETAEGEVLDPFGFEGSEGDDFEKFSIGLPLGELGGDQDADRHGDEAEDEGSNEEEADDFVVVSDAGSYQGEGRRGRGGNGEGEWGGEWEGGRSVVEGEHGFTLEGAFAGAFGLAGERNDEDAG